MRSNYATLMAKRRMDAERAKPGPDLAERLERVGAEMGEYPPEWPQVALLVKTLAGWKCERCNHSHGPTPWVLTVHHLIEEDKWNLNDWNLAALCQRCHLQIQNRVNFMQDWPFDHSPWMARHVEGYNEWARARGLPELSLNGVGPAHDHTFYWPASPFDRPAM
jgi:hypothetical protein